MANGDGMPYFLPHNRAKRLVSGLKEYEEPSMVYVYKANPDGSNGELLRIEQPPKIEMPRFNNRRIQK